MTKVSRWGSLCFIGGSLLFSVSVFATQFDAVLQWSKRAELSTLSNGVVDKVFVDVGDKVTQGQLLLQLDPVVFEKRVRQSRVSMQSAREAYQEAGRERDRAQELYDRTVLSDHDLQVAKNNYIKAKSDYEKARVRFAQAEYDFKYSRIVAPFNAIVLERKIQPGQIVKTDLKPVPMLTIAQSDRMRARVLVSESDLTSIQMRQSAKVISNDDAYSGEVVSIGFEPVVSSSGERRYPVDIEFATGDRVLRAGLSAKVEF